MQTGEPSYYDLKQINRQLNNELHKYIAAAFDHAAVRNELDRELDRFRFIQEYTQHAITIENLDEFFRFTAESVIKTFEAEISFVMIYDEARNGFTPAAAFGMDIPDRDFNCGALFASSPEGPAKGDAEITDIRQGMSPWDEMGLHQVIAAPFLRSENRLGGIVAAGRSVKRKAFYDEFAENLIAPFTVFAQQITSVLKNLDYRIIIQNQVGKLSTLHEIGTAIASVLDREELRRTTENLIVEKLGYDRAAIFLEEGPAGPGPEGTDLASAYTVPLMISSRVIGGLSAGYFGKERGITERDRTLLDALASQIAVSLENTRLIEKATRAERLSAIGEMAAGMAHEIRNPLSAIGTLIDILESQTSGGDPLLFKGIKEESRRLEQIITRFLNYARPYTPERRPADINLLLEEIMSILGKEERYRNTDFIRQFDREIGAVPLDADGIKQVFWNIILNGLEAMEGSGALTVRSAEEKERVVIEVEDTGPGIPEAVSAKIFEPFFTQKEKGTGLGMAIANKVVRAHGGEISLRRGAERGACIRMSLPKGGPVQVV